MLFSPNFDPPQSDREEGGESRLCLGTGFSFRLVPCEKMTYLLPSMVCRKPELMPDIQINTKEESVYSQSYRGCNIFGMPFIPYEQSLAAVTSVWLLFIFLLYVPTY